MFQFFVWIGRCFRFNCMDWSMLSFQLYGLVDAFVPILCMDWPMLSFQVYGLVDAFVSTVQIGRGFRFNCMDWSMLSFQSFVLIGRCFRFNCISIYLHTSRCFNGCSQGAPIAILCCVLLVLQVAVVTLAAHRTFFYDIYLCAIYLASYTVSCLRYLFVYYLSVSSTAACRMLSSRRLFIYQSLLKQAADSTAARMMFSSRKSRIERKHMYLLHHVCVCVPLLYIIAAASTAVRMVFHHDSYSYNCLSLKLFTGCLFHYTAASSCSLGVSLRYLFI